MKRTALETSELDRPLTRRHLTTPIVENLRNDIQDIFKTKPAIVLELVLSGYRLMFGLYDSPYIVKERNWLCKK